MLPGTHPSVAEGCSGGPGMCTTPGWSNVHLATSQVPGHADVLLAARWNPSCGQPSASALTATAVDAAGATTTGSLAPLSTTTASPGPGALTQTFTWKPSQPLAPGAYTLHVINAGSGQAGAGGTGAGGGTGSGTTVELSFVVGDAPPALTSPTFGTATEIVPDDVQLCCTSSTCGTTCTTVVERKGRELRLTIEPPSVNPAYLKYVVQNTNPAGTAAAPPTEVRGWEAAGPYVVPGWTSDGFPCLRVRTFVLGNDEPLTSDLFCPAELPIPAPIAHCEKLPAIVASCNKSAGNPKLAQDAAAAIEKQYCGSTGVGGGGGSAADGGSAGEGSNPSNAGNTGNAGNAAAPSPAASSSEGDPGCQMGTGRAQGGLFGIAALTGALAALRRRRGRGR